MKNKSIFLNILDRVKRAECVHLLLVQFLRRKGKNPQKFKEKKTVDLLKIIRLKLGRSKTFWKWKRTFYRWEEKRKKTFFKTFNSKEFRFPPKKKINKVKMRIKMPAVKISQGIVFNIYKNIFFISLITITVAAV